MSCSVTPGSSAVMRISFSVSRELFGSESARRRHSTGSMSAWSGTSASISERHEQPKPDGFAAKLTSLSVCGKVLLRRISCR